MFQQKKFIGREKEILALEKFYRRKNSTLIPIYGRRRVGKSEMILKFLKGKKGIYYLGKKASPQLQIKEFMKEASNCLELPLLENQMVNNWKDALNLVVQHSNAKKIVIALDEFQWIAQEEKSILSFLQELWDLNWGRQNNVMVILCGSYIGFMERDVLGSQSPLFGRRSGQMLIRPFDFLDAAKFLPNYGHQDAAKTYFICGGIPLYLNLFDHNRSIQQNIEEQFLDEYAPLHSEPNYLLREELREVEKFESILFALASKSSRRKDLSKITGIDNRALDYYLRSLQSLGYVEKSIPLCPSKRNQHPNYKLKDPLLKFWFRFIFPNETFLRHHGPQKTFQERIYPELASFFGNCFETLCKEAMPLLLKQENKQVSCETGSYWDKNMQIDLVSLREDGIIELGECKWKNNPPSLKTIEHNLTEKTKKYPNPDNQTIRMHFFSRSKPKSKNKTQIYTHSLNDLYALKNI